jgi:L-iditol 2-dehydrogenase
VLALAKVRAGPDAFELVERDEPEPGQGEVVLAVAAAGICGSDLHLLHGTLPLVEHAYPLWLGHEYAGTVAAVGPGVDTDLVGARVTAEPSAGCGRCTLCRGGRPNLCRERRFEAGGFASTLRVAADRLHRLPDHVPLTVGALVEPLACVHHGLGDLARLQPGERCVVIGPGPIGILAALLAEALGASALLVGRSTSRARLELARRLGLRHVAEAGRDDLHALVADLTDGDGADLVVGAGGAGVLPAALDLLARGGRYVELALGSGATTVDLDRFTLREQQLLGSLGHTPASWRAVIDLLERRRLDPERLEGLVTKRYPLRAWRDAFAAAAGRGEGKVVLEP